MEKITFTNKRGEVVEFFGAPFRLLETRGLGDVEADIQSEQAPFQDGDTYISTRLQSRFIELDFSISGNNYDEIQSSRVLLSRITNPKLGLGTLRYEFGDTVRIIQAVAESVPVYPSGRSNRTEFRQVGGISFKCPNPFWLTETIDAQPTFEPLFQFPFEGPFQMGISRDARILENTGDTDIPFTVEFYGPALNPRIDNLTTGEFIQINQELLDGEFMRITTADNNKRVLFIEPDGTERNVFNWIDIDSTFFKLVQGENEITYSADSNIQGAVVNFTYQQHYNSV